MKRKSSSYYFLKTFVPFKSFTLRVLSWLNGFFIPKEFRVPLELSFSYFDTLERLFRTRGLDDMIKYNKKVRSSVYSFLSGGIPDKSLKLTNDGIPRSLGPLIEILRSNQEVNGSPYKLRWLMTLLSSTRSLNSGTKPVSYDSIVTPPKGDTKDITLHIDLFWRKLGFNSKKIAKDTAQVEWKSFHLSTKSGPNGQALYTSIADLSVMPITLKQSIKIVGGERLYQKIEKLELHLLPLFKLFKYKKASDYRKVIYFPDREDKVRVIAILDYWSQTALRPLHTYLFKKVLRKIPQDCTFDQGSFSSKLSPGYYSSVDLKDATDRFPISLIQKILEGRFPKEYCEAWRDIMVGYPFRSPEGYQLMYKTGNPLGAYSSWASFALAHHYVLFYCCMELKKDWKRSNYVLLGDDLVIGDRELAEKYKSVLKELDIPYSVAKTHDSSYFFEFAKRIVYRGVEITAFPISGLKEVHKRYHLLVSFLINQELKGWIPQFSYYDIILGFYSYVLHMRTKQRKDIANKSKVTEIITRVILGLLSAEEGIKLFFQAKNIPPFRTFQMTEMTASHLFKTAALLLFTESNSSERLSKGKPLGELAVQLVLIITDPDSPFNLDLDLIYAIPILQIHGKVEELYMQTQKNARRIDTLEGGDWPLFMRSLTIPISDEVYVQRNFDIIPSFSAAIATKISEQLEGIRLYYDK